MNARVCEMRTRRGHPCRTDADREYDGVAVCHIHDPYGIFARQHPKTQRRLLGEIALAQQARIGMSDSRQSREEYRRPLRAVVCPECGAGPTEHCHSRRPEGRLSVHPARRERALAVRAGREHLTQREIDVLMGWMS